MLELLHLAKVTTDAEMGSCLQQAQSLLVPPGHTLMIMGHLGCHCWMQC